MTKDEKLNILRDWHAAMEKSNMLIEPIIAAAKLGPESPLCGAVWLLQDALTASTSARIGDGWGNLDWYAHENDLGKNKDEAGPPGKMRKISTLKDLMWLIKVSA